MSIIKSIYGHLLDFASGLANVPAAVKALAELKGSVGQIIEISGTDAEGVVSGLTAVNKPSGDGVTVPTKVSELANDAGYQTEAQVNALIAAVPTFKTQVVSELPAVGEDNTLYLVPFAAEDGQFLEYLYVNGAWEVIGSGVGSGEDVALSTAQINALHGMFKVCLFDDSRDVAGAISAFEEAFGITDSGGGDTGDGEDTPDATAHTITYALTNVALSNTAASVADGESYSAELTVADPLKLTSISITMGGVDITDSAYGDGYILIQEVTGDVVITAVAAELEYLDTVNCGTVDVIGFYTDDGATSDGYVNYQPLTVSTDITESNADVVAIVTNSGDSDVTTTVNTGSVASTDTINNYNLNYATKGSSVTIRAGQSIEVPFTVHAGHRAGVCTSDQTVTAAITGKLDVHEADPLTVATKTVGSTTYFYAGETTESESLNYVWSGKMAVAQIAYDADTVLRITIRNGTDSDFKNISFRVGAVASPDFGSGNVFYAETQAETGIKAGLYMVFAYTVPAGYYAMAYSGNADAEIIIEEVG